MMFKYLWDDNFISMQDPNWNDVVIEIIADGIFTKLENLNNFIYLINLLFSGYTPNSFKTCYLLKLFTVSVPFKNCSCTSNNL